MNKDYDKNNIFYKIINGQVPCDKVLETEHCFAFKDINPRAKIHVLLIPKKPYININDFILYSENNEKIDIFNAIYKVADLNNLKDEGYRILTNVGKNGH